MDIRIQVRFFLALYLHAHEATERRCLDVRLGVKLFFSHCVHTLFMGWRFGVWLRRRTYAGGTQDANSVSHALYSRSHHAMGHQVLNVKSNISQWTLSIRRQNNLFQENWVTCKSGTTWSCRLITRHCIAGVNVTLHVAQRKSVVDFAGVFANVI